MTHSQTKPQGMLEHANITVSDPEATARLMQAVFNWDIRWHGPSQMGGYTWHVGSEASYLALYTYDNNPDDAPHAGRVKSGLNHVGVVVDDLEATEQAVIAAGLEPFNHGNYEPGRRFYFLDGDGVEYEVVSYTPAES